MSQSPLAGALAAGASIVTPNNRLAREVTLRHDAACHAEGRRAWIPAQAMPWTMWLERLRLSALAAGALPPTMLLDASAERELWHRIILGASPSLLNPRGAARHAADAWSLFHAWRNAGESLHSITARDGEDDAATFGVWAERYQRKLDALGAIDRAALADALAAAASLLWPGNSGDVVLYGFTALASQQRRLIAALRAAGLSIDELPAMHETAVSRGRVSCPTPSEELAQALGFARARLAAEPQARIAIVVADLETRRDETIALAEEILCPDALLALAPDAPRPYDVSLGEPLAAAPIVACASTLIALSIGAVDAASAASAIRAPFLPDASAMWHSRAALERGWRDEGRRDVAWNDVLAALRRVDASLSMRYAGIAPPSRSARLPREWARAWSDWLTALGWPGTAPLSSAQWQAREAWSAALAQFAASGPITGPLTAADAMEALRALLADTRWAAESPPTPIRILGVLEAAGLSLDHAWLAGFDAHRWPPAASPSPFLPLGWQHARGVTRAHPDTALAHAQALTLQLGTIAREIVVSHAERIDDAPSTISPLFASWPPVAAQVPPASARFRDAFAAVELARSFDDTAPALTDGAPMGGGATLFESHSTCPFQAFARFRLRADAWDECPDGLSMKERGNVLHAVLKAFWDGVNDHATLANLDSAQMMARVAAAVAQGKAKLPPARWRALPPAIASAETQRLAAILAAWLDEVERGRPPFRVRAHEQSIDCEIEGVGVRVRVDRIDELAEGGLAIIDYKSGRAVKPQRWFAARPEGIQLAVYAHGVERTGDDAVRALAYAQVRAGEIAVSGIAEAGDAWPGLDVPGAAGSRLPVVRWTDARRQLRERVATLARGVRSGDARVAPRDRAACQYCGLQPLCRIQVLDDRGERASIPGEAAPRPADEPAAASGR
jgi:ATP-dependent helicase/nuclease subunit B